MRRSLSRRIPHRNRTRTRNRNGNRNIRQFSSLKKGFWINHVLEIKNPEKFSAYVEASKPCFAPGNKWGAKMLLLAPVASTLIGDPVQFGALVEFDCVQAAIDIWDDPQYAEARAILGPLDDESGVVERRVCVIEGESIPVTAAQGFWLNHVKEVKDQTAFFAYAQASMPCFTTATFGPVQHQHAGKEKVVLAAALGFPSVRAAIDVYDTPEYAAAKACGGMESGEGHVVDRTIACVQVP